MAEEMPTTAEDRLPLWGVGPRTFFPALIYAVFAAAGTYLFAPDLLVLGGSTYAILAVVGAVLVVAAIPILAVAGRKLTAAYREGRLVTDGPFAWSRNPLYAAWILLVLPGLSLLTGAWPVLLTPLVAYVSFRIWIVREERDLAQQFGQAYEAYRAEVPRLVPYRRPRGA